MNVLMYKSSRIWPIMFIFQFLILMTQSSPNFSKVEVFDQSIKCGECPCLNPCSQLSPPPPPPSPPPRFGYVTSTTSPPPPRFVYVAGPRGNLYPTNPFTLNIYSNVAHDPYIVRMLLLVGCVTLQLLIFW